MFKKIIFLFGLVLFGAGCQALTLPGATVTPSDVSSTSTAEAAAARLEFSSGDSFEIHQVLFGLGTPLADLLSSQSGIRSVTVENFIPEHQADLRWLSTIERESQSSRQAREQYEAQLKTRKKGEPFVPPPTVEIEKVQATGTVVNINLKEPHELFLPAYWSLSGETNALSQKSGLWLADDAFLELANNHRTAVYLDLFGEAASHWAERSQDLKSFLDRLRKKSNAVGEKKDIATLAVGPEPVEWPLVINGQAVKVSAWRGKNAFGEFVILNNRQNPLILKLTIQPLFASASEWLSGTRDWKKVFGYEITNLLVQKF